MDTARLADDDASTDHTEDPEVSTPVTFSANASPLLSEQMLPPDPATAPPKKKKKKKSKRAGKVKEAAPATPTTPSKPRSQNSDDSSEDRPQVLCISRNKHWRYISSYHGPWLQLPFELLESLFYLNSNPETYTSPPRSLLAPPVSPVTPGGRPRTFSSLDDISPPDSPRALIPAIAMPQNGKQLPPPIDPGVLRSVTNIRRLIDYATDLSVRASSGISPVELSSLRNNTSYNGTSLAAAQSLGLNPLGTNNIGGRNTSMSANRVHRLRALAVHKLAQAYMEDEIASSVMVMQGGSVFDDVAERVLRHDPNNADAKYVHFFHEKIPSSHRQLAESTSTTVLDELISLYPHQLEYYRTRGIVHCFREEFAQATKDFTYALKEARAQRRAKTAQQNPQNEPRSSKSKRRKGTARHTTGQAPSDGTSVLEGSEGADGENSPVHPSVLPDAPEPIETQLLFFRGAAYLQHAVHLIESALIDLEGVSKPTGLDGADLRLCSLETGRYGGVEIGNPEGPLGPRDSTKVKAYRNVLAVKSFRDQIVSLIKRSMRDHEKFLSHFDGGGATAEGFYEGDIAFQVEYAFQLSESVRPGSQGSSPPPPFPNMPSVLTTYHPLLVESHFSVLICHLLLADFVNILPQFAKTAVLVDGVEGYPVFLPPRSMGQAEFIEVLERLGTGWRNGIQPHSLTVNYRGKARSGPTASLRAIEAPPLPPQLITPSSISESPSSISTISAFSPALVAPVPSSSSPSISSAALLANTFAGIDLNGSPGLTPSSSSSRIPTPAPVAEHITSPGLLYAETTIEDPLPSSSLLSSSTHLRPDLTGDYLYAGVGTTSTSRSASVSRKSSIYTLDSPRSPSRSPSLPQFGESSSTNHKDKGKKANGTPDSYGSNTNIIDDHSPPPIELAPEIEYRLDSSHVLDCARILLAPVVKRQKERALQAAADKAAGIKKPPPIHIPLHGPRVEIILAWLGAVQFPEIEGA